MPAPLLLAVLAGLFGLVIGSFLNVVVWRLPRGESLVSPPSHCPSCGARIAWRDNVPVLSWLILRGRCRRCRGSIAVGYPLVELATGALFVLAALSWPDHLLTAVVVALALSALLAISLIDWEHKIIPDAISKPGIALAILLAPATVLHPGDWLAGTKPALSQWSHAAVGALVGGGVILLIRWLGSLALRKEAMGLGDAKLLAFLGALSGPLQALYALVLACFAGALVGGARWLLTRNRPLRFPLVVRQGGTDHSFASARVGDGRLEVLAPSPGVAGEAVRLRLVLPAADVLTDADVPLDLGGRLEETLPERGQHRWRIQVVEAGEEARSLLRVFAASRRYVPFGPFLALGGAAVLLFGDEVHWLVTVGYPAWARGLFDGS